MHSPEVLFKLPSARILSPISNFLIKSLIHALEAEDRKAAEAEEEAEVVEAVEAEEAAEAALEAEETETAKDSKTPEEEDLKIGNSSADICLDLEAEAEEMISRALTNLMTCLTDTGKRAETTLKKIT